MISSLIADADARREGIMDDKQDLSGLVMTDTTILVQPPELVEVPRVRWLISNTGMRTLQWQDNSGKWLPVPEVEAKDAESSP